MAVETVPVPGPRPLPFVGNIFDIDPRNALKSTLGLAEKYGEIFRMFLPWGEAYVVNTVALVQELNDESRFQKVITAALIEVRQGVNDGLFTAHNNEPSWGIAHRLLMPAFGPASIQKMFPEMREVAAQLALKWARHGGDAPIMVTEDFTRLALDTIALCSMDFRFNSYYHDKMHPFIDAMSDFLTESGVRGVRPWFLKPFARSAERKFWDDINTLRKTAQDVLDARKKAKVRTGQTDLLSAMLDGVDPKTGQKMTDSSIIDNLITFLIAGHETTSGMLSFAFYELIKHPEAYRKAQKEVDEVIGRGPITVEHMKKLPYITAILRETLRYSPTIPVTAVESIKDQTVGGGKYVAKKGQLFLLQLASSHRDPAVYGETANQWDPDRMLDENFERLTREYPGCWKPFGNGARGCIGRAFAWQEAMVIMAMLLQNFDFQLHDENYTLEVLETLTIKPKDFYMRASLRHGLTPTELEQSISGGSGSQKTALARGVGAASNGNGTLRPLTVLYGSNTGTCEALAQRLAMDAPSHGYEATVISTLDTATGKLPKDQPVVVITTSYEGEPADNAAEFVGWLKALKGSELEGVSYAIFGCGHHDWVSTFHKIPKLVDDTMETRGADRICEAGLSDVAQGEMFTDFEQWEDEVLWPAVEAKFGPVEGFSDQNNLDVQFSTPRASTLRQDVKEAVVTDERILTGGAGAIPKKHLEVSLPQGTTYRAGDYLAVLPINPKETVARVMRRFNLAWDSHVTVSGDTKKTALPTGVPVPVHEVLGSYVELSQPATKRGIQTLAQFAAFDSDKAQLSSLASDPSLYTSTIIASRLSALDLLDRFPSVQIPFGVLLSLLPPMRVRQYSISSSPLPSPSSATLTYSLLDAPSLADPGRKHVGVATSYLANLKKGDRLFVAVRPSHSSFHLPTDEKTPVVMIGAGAGIAPFRGFIQERAAQIAGGKKLGKALLFFGCRGPQEAGDDLYREELDKWEKQGAVVVRRAFSRETVNAEAQGSKYVGDRIWLEKEEVKKLWQEGATVYVCGSRAVGDGVKTVLAKVVLGEEKGTDEDDVKKWFEGVRNVRVAVDVFD